MTKKTITHIKTTKWSYLITLFTLLFFVNCTFDINKPVVGDRYVMPLPNHNFTILKITAVQRKKISYLQNDLYVSELKYIDSIDVDTNYTDSPKTIPYKAFKTLPLTYHNPKPTKK